MFLNKSVQDTLAFGVEVNAFRSQNDAIVMLTVSEGRMKSSAH